MADIKRPSTVEEATGFTGAGAGESAFLAGGTSPKIRSGEFATLISLQDLGLSYIRSDIDGIHVGAMTTLQEIVESDMLPGSMSTAAGLTASRTIRNMRTVGGDIAEGSPQSTLIPLLIALGAGAAFAVSSQESIADVFGDTDGGLITEIVIGPGSGLVSGPSRSGIRALSRTSHSRKSLICAAACSVDGRQVSDVRVIVGDGVDSPRSLTEVSSSLDGGALPDKSAIAELVTSHFSPASDYHASAEYKRYLAGVYIADLLHELAGGQV